MGIIWNDDRPLNQEPACAAVEQPYEGEWYADYYVASVDLDVTWDAFTYVKERLGAYGPENRDWAARVPLGEGRLHFYIRDLSEFLLFKLTWL